MDIFFFCSMVHTSLVEALDPFFIFSFFHISLPAFAVMSPREKQHVRTWRPACSFLSVSPLHILPCVRRGFFSPSNHLIVVLEKSLTILHAVAASCRALPATYNALNDVVNPAHQPEHAEEVQVLNMDLQKRSFLAAEADCFFLQWSSAQAADPGAVFFLGRNMHVQYRDACL